MTFNEGDRVYVMSGGWGRGLSPAVISRVTKTQAIIGEGAREQRFNRETGRLTGASSWDTERIELRDETLDRQYRSEVTRILALRLSESARKGDAAEIRAAFEKWNASESQVEGER